MGEFFDSISQVRQNIKPYKEWEQAQRDKEAQRQELHKTVNTPQDKLELSQSYGKTLVDAINVIDEYSENKSQNVEMGTEMAMGLAVGAFSMLPMLIKPAHNVSGKQLAKTVTLQYVAFPVATAGLAIAGLLWGNAKQKEASRIGRFQARENELKDVNRFIVYTLEQIAKAKEIVKNIPDPKDDKKKNEFAEMIDTIKSINKDKPAYLEWREKVKNQEANKPKSANISFTKEQLAKAKIDQELITETIKKIDIKAESYSENIETAANTLPALSLIPGALLGIVGGKLTQYLDKSGKLPFKMGKYAKVIGGMGSAFILPIIVGIYATTLQKESARVGRFKAKQELMNDPHSFTVYNEAQMQSVQHIKAPKEKQTFFKGLVDDVKFFVSANKDFREYKEYKKTQLKEDKKLREALKQVELNPGQLEEAKAFREKTLRTFDKMDEMSQRYSEDVEAATQVGQQVAGLIPAAIAGILGLTGFVLHKKGFFSLDKGGKILNNILHGKNSEASKAFNELAEATKGKKIKEILDNISTDKTGAYDDIAKSMQKYEQEFSKIWIGRAEKIQKKFANFVDKHPKIGDYINKVLRDLGEIMQQGNPTESLASKLFSKPSLRNLMLGACAFVVVPVFTLMLGSTFAFQSFLTNLQKQGGKIGLMKAMEELKDPANFVDNIEPNTPQTIKEQPTTSKTLSFTDWINKSKGSR